MLPPTLVEPLMRPTFQYGEIVAGVFLVGVVTLAIRGIEDQEWMPVIWAGLVTAPIVTAALQWLFTYPPVADGARRELRVPGRPPMPFDDIERIYVKQLTVPPVAGAELEPSLEAAWRAGRWSRTYDGDVSPSSKTPEPYALLIVGRFEPVKTGACHDRFVTQQLGRELAALTGKPLCDERGQRLDTGIIAPWWQTMVEPRPAPTYPVARADGRAEIAVPLPAPSVPAALVRVALLLGAAAFAAGLVYVYRTAEIPHLNPASWVCAAGAVACLWMFRGVVEAPRYVFRVEGGTLAVEGVTGPPRLFPLDTIEWIGVHAALGGDESAQRGQPTYVLTIAGNDGNAFQASDFSEAEARGIAWTLAGLCAPRA